MSESRFIIKPVWELGSARYAIYERTPFSAFNSSKIIYSNHEVCDEVTKSLLTFTNIEGAKRYIDRMILKEEEKKVHLSQPIVHYP